MEHDLVTGEAHLKAHVSIEDLAMQQTFQGGPDAVYYRNLTDADFLAAFNLEGWFAGFHFMLCPNAQDLYFWGIVRSGQPTVAECDAIRSRVLSIDAHLGSVNGSVTISHYASAVGFVPRGVVPYDYVASGAAATSSLVRPDFTECG